MKQNGSKFSDPTLDKVLFLGPSLKARGGMASVLSTYRENFEPFHFIATNSPRGTIPGLGRLALLMVRLPLERLRGRRLLHIHYAGGKSFRRKRMIARWGRLLGFRTIMHCHCNLIAASEKAGIAATASALSHADYNIVLASPYLEFALRTLHLPQAHTSILNNIAPSAETPPATESKPGTCPHPVTFLFLGLINQPKGIYDLLKAASLLKERGRHFRLIVGGAGERQQFDSEVEKLQLEDTVECRGWVEGKAKDRAMAESHILVLPSYTEGMPISVLEAMGLGMPSIATSVGALPDMVADGLSGAIIPPGDIEALARAMQSYIDNPSMINLHGKEALARSEKYSASSVFDAITKIYHDIL